MIATEIAGEVLELLPVDAMVKAAKWLIAHDCPILASALWREGEDLGDVSRELDSIPAAAPEEVLALKRKWIAG